MLASSCSKRLRGCTSVEEESRSGVVRSGELGVLRPSTSMCRGEGPRERGSCLPTTTLGDGAAEEEREEEERAEGEEDGGEEEVSVGRG